MLEVHVVRSDNAHLYRKELEQSFKGRYRACVLERGWKELERADGRDVDQFDTADAVHLLAIESREVIGGMRLNPSIGPTLLADVFPQLSAKPIIRSRDIYEASRLWVAKEHRTRFLRPTVSTLLTAASLEFALALGLRKIRSMCESWRVNSNLQLGWTLRTLGPSMQLSGADVVAIEKDVSEAIWIRMCEKTSIPGAVLIWNGTAAPAHRLPALIRAAVA
jgi:acyl-homoserine lactone synthase